MKSNYIIGLLVLALSIFSSCTDVLDKTPVLENTESNIFSDSNKIKSNLLGIYGSAKNTIAYKGTAYADIRGEDIISLSSNVYECYSVYEMAVGLSTTDNTQTWSSLYYVINEVNTFLENIESNRAVVGDLYNQYVSEAKFLRALSFYYLNKLYALPYKLGADSKSIPLRLKAVNSPDDNNLACSTVSAVFEQILSDVSEEDRKSVV